MNIPPNKCNIHLSKKIWSLRRFSTKSRKFRRTSKITKLIKKVTMMSLKRWWRTIKSPKIRKVKILFKMKIWSSPKKRLLRTRKRCYLTRPCLIIWIFWNFWLPLFLREKPFRCRLKEIRAAWNASTLSFTYTLIKIIGTTFFYLHLIILLILFDRIIGHYNPITFN